MEKIEEHEEPTSKIQKIEEKEPTKNVEEIESTNEKEEPISEVEQNEKVDEKEEPMSAVLETKETEENEQPMSGLLETDQFQQEFQSNIEASVGMEAINDSVEGGSGKAAVYICSLLLGLFFTTQLAKYHFCAPVWSRKLELVDDLYDDLLSQVHDEI